MPVVSINVGPKRVHVTAYCPDDELGLLACDYVLARAVAASGAGWQACRDRPRQRGRAGLAYRP